MRIVVRGVPAPQGSKRHVGHGVMVESSRAVGPWREAVRAETQRAMNGDGPFGGPVHVELIFLLPRPKSLPKKIIEHTRRPDLDKLVRAVLDGLTAGGAWDDDSQVTYLKACKEYAVAEPPGCMIDLFELEA